MISKILPNLRKRTSGFVLAVVSAGHIFGLPAEGSEMTSIDFFKLVEKIIVKRGSTPETWAKLLGSTPIPDTSKSNEYTLVYNFKGSKLYPEDVLVEVRIDRRKPKQGILILTLDPKDNCVPVDDVMSKYGKNFELSVPTPRQPIGSPTYYVYKEQWGDIRFGISQRHKSCVESVVLTYHS